MSLTLDELLAEVASAPSVTPADQDPRLGTMVGPYKIQKRLGRGGMGTVYLARDTRLQRDVALKMLHDESPLACQELLREARRAATVSHASIAQVFDVNEDAPPYIAMEFVEGDSLHERITSSPPGPEESLRILGETADAVAALHAQGIVHRDLTPRNIALTADGHLKILDFGIAMPLEDSGTSSKPESILYAGTERYVAPERTDGRPPSAKEDVFSIGVLAQDLFGHEPPPVVAELLERCRSPDEAMRPSDLRDVARQLHEAQAPKAKRRASTAAVSMGAVLAVCALVAGIYSMTGLAHIPETAPRTARHESEVPTQAATGAPPTRLTFYSEDQSIRAMSRNGDVFLVTDTLGVSRFNGDSESERLVLPQGFRATSAHETAVGVLVLGVTREVGDAYYYSDGESSRVAIDGPVHSLTVAHGGRRVAIVESNTIHVGTLDDERHTLLDAESPLLQVQAEVSFDQPVAWSPDDERLLLMTWEGGTARLEEVEVATGERRAVFESENLVGRLGTYAFTYFDNDTVAFTMREPNGAGVGIYVLSLLRGAEPRLVARFPTAIQELHWCPSRASFRFVAYDPDYKIYRRLLTEDEPQRMTFSDHRDWVTSFSTDGEDIHFSRMTHVGSRAFTVPRLSPSSEVAVVLESAADLPSPTRALRAGLDTWLAFLPREDGRHELLRIGSAGTHSIALLEATPGRWRHAPPFGAQVRQGGGRLFFGTSTKETLQVSEVDGHNLHERFIVEGSDRHSWFVFAVSQDSERFAYRDAGGVVLTDQDGLVTRRISRSSEVLQSAGFLRDRSLIVSAASARQFSLFHINGETDETTVLASSYHRWFGSVATSPTRDEVAYTTVGWDTDVFELTLSP